MSNSCSIELKQVSLNLVLDQDSYEINFISIGEKKFFDQTLKIIGFSNLDKIGTVDSIELE